MAPSDEEESEDGAKDTEKKKRGQKIVLNKRKQREVDDEDGILVEEDTNQGTVSLCVLMASQSKTKYSHRAICLPHSNKTREGEELSETVVSPNLHFEGDACVYMITDSVPHRYRSSGTTRISSRTRA